MNKSLPRVVLALAILLGMYGIAQADSGVVLDGSAANAPVPLDGSIADSPGDGRP